jgi:hypothetical protein
MFVQQSNERKGVCGQVLQCGILSTPTSLNKRSPELVVPFAPLVYVVFISQSFKGLARLVPSCCTVSVSDECGVELMDDGTKRGNRK